jgi:hypothetical protein
VTALGDFAKQHVVDFFEGRGDFSERSEYVGVEASRIPDLFVQDFAARDSPEQRALAEAIAEIALGNVSELAQYVPAAARLMVDLAVRGYAAAFSGVRDDLERELADPARLARWSEAEDGPLPEGLAFQEDWHYPLHLWGVLYVSGSSLAAGVYEYLQQHARSGRFKQTLAHARGVYDRRRGPS